MCSQIMKLSKKIQTVSPAETHFIQMVRNNPETTASKDCTFQARLKFAAVHMNGENTSRECLYGQIRQTELFGMLG